MLTKIEFHPEGPMTSRLMIVGEAPGEKEVAEKRPFVGPSGWLLDKVLEEAGLHRSHAFLTNVCRERPNNNDVESWIASSIKARDHTIHQEVLGKWVTAQIRIGREILLQEIEACRPMVVVAVGNLALWALTGKWGIRKWRSSVMQCEVNGHVFKVIPTIHPAAVLREAPLRGLLVHDLRRVAREMQRGPIVTKPNWKFIVRPTFDQAVHCLDWLVSVLNTSPVPVPLAADIETRAGHTSCLGIAWSKLEALCIPFMCVERPQGYWTVEEEAQVIIRLRRVLSHWNALVIWQNGAYDHQYEWRWHQFIPKLGWDTMLAQHSIWSISPKGLDHLSSLYCDYHYYWKDDGKEWNPSIPEEQHWRYNCEDNVRTFEVYEEEKKVIDIMSKTWPELWSVVNFQHRMQPLFVKMMNRGVRADESARLAMKAKLSARRAEIQKEIELIAGQELNLRSPKQMVDFFYGRLGLSPIFKRNPDGTRGNPTCDDDALEKIQSRVPVLRPLIARMQAQRSAGVYESTFVDMRKDIDGRYRCEFNVAGTKSYRLSSSTNAFGSGGNLQTIPVDEDEDDPHIPLPNIKELFLFDHGYMGFDLDGDSADLRIVTWESGCKGMMELFAAGVKPYLEIAKEFYHDPNITKRSRKYTDMKKLCHGTNYGGEAAGLSQRIGLPIRDVERIQGWYFGKFPEIKKWQIETVKEYYGRGYIQNCFGNRLFNWDRESRSNSNTALSWKPQSTVGQIINRVAQAIDERLPEVQLLLQVHDSLMGQFPIERPELGTELKRIGSSIPVPCAHGTIYIPAGLKTSLTNWGACE